MDETLNDLARILTKHDHLGQAEVVQQLLQGLRSGDRSSFPTLLQSVDMWGGSGAVWEVGDLGDDTRAFRQAIIDLAAEMDKCGLGMERSRFVASTFAEWNRLGV